MPSYDYIDSDGNITEHVFLIGKAPQEFEGKKRMVSGLASITFKGGGWTRESINAPTRRLFGTDWDKIAKDNNVM